MRNQEMPRIDLEHLRTILLPADFELVRGIVSTQGKNKGRLRASKPKVDRLSIGLNKYGLEQYEPDETQGKTAYIWRMVAFSASPKSQHHCMPCTADFDVPGHWGDEKRAILQELDAIVDAVLDTIPADEWHGIRRWGNAFGVIGTPQVTSDGSIIYR